MALSEFAVRKAKPRDNAYKLFDGGGLFLHVQPNGSKHWRLKYRFSGRENLLSFGPYPAVTIADARKRREAAKAHLAAGQFPAGSMGPKIQAAIEFIEAGGKHVIITRPEDIELAVDGEAGTHIHRDADLEDL